MEALLEQNSIYLILLVVFIFLIIGYKLVHKLPSARDRKLELIIGIPAAVSVILVAYNLILSTHSNNRIENNRIAHNTLENIQRNWLAPQIELSKSYPEGYFLYKSMTPDVDYGLLEPLQYDPAKRKQIEIVNSIRIFQAMEDFLTIGFRDLTGSYVWINNFLMWMQSPLLQDNWKVLSFNYSADTREMVENIIIESNKLKLKRKANGKLSKADYDAVSQTFQISLR